MTPQRSRAILRPIDDRAGEVATWAASGAMALTGRSGARPLGPPAGLVPKLEAIAGLIGERSAAMGQRVRVDPVALLGERAALAGLGRHGDTSCGGASRLLSARDGWLAVSLAREEDVDLVPAWLQRSGPIGDAWEVVAGAVRRSGVDELVARAVLLGLPVGAMPAAPAAPATATAPLAPLPVRAERVACGPVCAILSDLVVVDLSALWAGPLCGSLLAVAGAGVIKVESIHRPDGARGGSATFFDLLNAGKRSVALDLRAEEGRRALEALIARADVVIEGSRPRALEQLGIRAAEVLRGGGPRVWASITGHGRSGPGRDRVAFGDDAAVAGGLVSWDDQRPCFCADAVADPTTGLVTAAAVLDALVAGGRWLLDVSMAGVAAHLAGPTLPVTSAPAAAAPRARRPVGRGPALGAHTNAVLARLAAR